jgi:hypothetical protein
MRPSIFDTSPPLFLDRPDSLTRRLPFDFRMSFLLLPWIYLVPCTISHIISFCFLLDTGFFFLSSPYTAIHFPLDIHFNSSALSPWPIHHSSLFTFFSIYFIFLPPSLHYFYLCLFILLYVFIRMFYSPAD